MTKQELYQRTEILMTTGPTATVTMADRDALSVAIVMQGFDIDTAWPMLFDATHRQYIQDNDAALQMLARQRAELVK